MSEKASLGQGYNVEAEEFCGQCVRGGMEFAGNQQSQLTFDRSMSEDAAASELGFEVGVKARYGLFSGSVAATFASESASSDYSDVTIYSHVISFKNAKFRFPGLDTGLTPEGQAARGTSGGTFVGENWPITCGHEYVSQITLGAKLLVAVKVEFATREDKQAFSGEVNFQGPPVEVEASLRMASQRFGKTASLSLSAFQLGGDVRKLSEVFGTDPGGAPLLVASLQNPEAVLAALNAAVKYGREQFTDQVDPEMPLDSPGGPAQLSYLTSPWAELGLFSVPPVIGDGVRLARRLISDEFEKNARYMRRVSRILNGPVRLSPRQLEHFKNLQRTVGRNLSLIQEAANVCYTDFARAAGKVAEVIEQLQDFTPEEFDVRPESFAQWWDMRNLPQMQVKDRDALQDIAAPLIADFVDFNAIEDQGLALQQKLALMDGGYPTGVSAQMFNSNAWSVMAESKITALSLSCAGDEDPEDFRPLRFTPRLQSLSSWACHKLDMDLGPVAGLPDLAKLSIGNTRVEDVGPLAGLAQLKEITLEGPVTDLSPLRGLVKLREISITGAGITDLSPLAALQDLRSVILTGSPVSTVAPLLGLPKLRGFEVGSVRAPVESMAELAAVPRFATFASQAARLLVQERPVSGIAETIPAADVVWTRRGTSNLFDTLTTGPTFDGEVAGTGAFTGVQSNEDVTVIMFLHRRAGTTVRYFAQLSENRTDANGMVIRNGTLTGECLVRPA
ncbi:leucine-rich repeat domain-containing protein [Pseudarthrobacter sp. H2]|uniref:leucine-rich repeat domain-containing protein n=1 Tax=Pseudarthrobacter sp. H2 TaxID=3418415 RepID=UPI003CEB6031